MKAVRVIICCVVLGCSAMIDAAAQAGETQKQEEKKGLTVEELGRGLKSAEQNIEKEIPKIGPAIGKTVKKLAGKDAPSDQKPAKQDK